MKIAKTLAALTLLCCSINIAAAGDGSMSSQPWTFAASTYHSFKGFGLACDFAHTDNSFGSATIYADIYDLIDRLVRIPGVAANVSHELVIKELQLPQGELLTVYAGPGFSVGYVHDYQAYMGLMAALSINAGLRADFPRHISMSLEFEGDLGLHIHYNEKLEAMESKMYKNGYRRALVPQVRIAYTF